MMRTLKRAVLVLAVLAAILGLIASVSSADAETPAERCKRETTAYNNAWKNTWAQANPGKKPSDAPKPPVPYKCGGNSGPAPTLPPTSTTPEVAPETTSPTTTGPKEQGSGADLTGPTERRDREVGVGSGQPTIGERPRDPRRPAASRVPSSIPAVPSRPGATTLVPSSPGGEAGKPRATSRSAEAGTPLSLDTYKHNASFDPFGDTPPPSDPANDGCRYCQRDDAGRILNGPANSPDGWANNFGCPDGTHASRAVASRCYTDYDWHIENRRMVSRGPRAGEAPIGSCSRPFPQKPGECSQGVELNKETSQSVSKTSSKEGSVGVDVRGVNVGGTLGSSTTTDSGSVSGLGTSGSWNAPDDLKPGEEIAYYQIWELWTYDVVSERNGEYTSYPAYQWVPTASTHPVRGPIGSHLQWNG